MESIVVTVNFKEALGVQAGGTHLRGGSAHYNVTAVAALPHLDLALFKDLSRLHIVQQGTIALLVALLDGGYQTELGGKLREPLLFGGFGKAVVHIGPLVVFTLSGVEQVLGSASHTMQFLKPQLCMGLLVLGGLQEQLCNLLIALVLSHGGEIGVLVPGLGLSGKGRFQILLGLGAGVLVRTLDGSFLDQFKGGGGLLADGAELRGAVAFVNIAADFTFPLLHTLFFSF